MTPISATSYSSSKLHKWRMTPFIIAMMLCTQTHAGAQSQSSFQEEAQALVAHVQQRQQVVEAIEQNLKALDERIETVESKLDQQWSQLDDSQRQSMRQELQNLRAGRIRLAELHGSLRQNTSEALVMVKAFTEELTRYVAQSESVESLVR